MKKNSKIKATPKARIASPAAKVLKTTASRNSPVPKPMSARNQITHEMIAKRAYEIFRGGTGGDQMHNWLRAEKELKAGL